MFGRGSRIELKEDRSTEVQHGFKEKLQMWVEHCAYLALPERGHQSEEIECLRGLTTRNLHMI